MRKTKQGVAAQALEVLHADAEFAHRSPPSVVGARRRKSGRSGNPFCSCSAHLTGIANARADRAESFGYRIADVVLRVIWREVSARDFIAPHGPAGDRAAAVELEIRPPYSRSIRRRTSSGLALCSPTGASTT